MRVYKRPGLRRDHQTPRTPLCKKTQNTSPAIMACSPCSTGFCGFPSCGCSGGGAFPEGGSGPLSCRTRWCRPSCSVEGTFLPPCCVLSCIPPSCCQLHHAQASCCRPSYCGQSCCRPSCCCCPANCGPLACGQPSCF
ncbi:keratin-associated protein 1-3-like [Ornithorhynchus anatinus]|uniref:keratin-associated protein 1-3-like n=1 Tax=Ornithorhynchus anatinus TaxID=9258 RepID=UPI0010A91814|nr:keratin-associated protein 1-3-like [Ornithorhynchus anatinus]